MALILNIDTATTYASVCLSTDTEIAGFAENGEQKEHASFLHNAIKQLTEQSRITLKDLDAVAVTSGPGSYTGLRVGMASAKGICYSLNKPLITVNTLEVMTQAMVKELQTRKMNGQQLLFCPMIDARRMEVFTALYTNHLENILTPAVIELTPTYFEDFLSKHSIAFFGSGSAKFKTMLKHQQALFFESYFSARDLAILASQRFERREFASLAYAEPFYAKEFYSTQKGVVEGKQPRV